MRGIGVLIILLVILSSSFVIAIERQRIDRGGGGTTTTTIATTANTTTTIIQNTTSDIDSSPTPYLSVPTEFELTGIFPNGLNPGVIYSILAASDGFVYAGPNINTILYTNDFNFESTWQHANTLNDFNFLLYELSNGTIITAGRSRPNNLYALNKNKDGWHRFSTFPGFIRGSPRTFLETSDGKYIIGGQKKPYIITSLDQGVTWVESNIASSDVFDLFESNSNTIYAANSESGLKKSTDGIIWEKVNIPSNIDNVRSVTETHDGVLRDYIGGANNY